MARKFFIIRGEKRRHSRSYVEYFQRRIRENFRSGLDYFAGIFGIIATTKTDANSYYELDFLDSFSRKEALHFYYVKNKDTVLLKSITQLESDDFKLDLYMPIKKKQS